jgi:hypothetical protein
VKTRVFWGAVGIVLAIGLVRLYGPFGVIREQSLRTAQLRATRVLLLGEGSSLEGERIFLASEAGREAAARQMGYLRPGERRVVFVPAGGGHAGAGGGKSRSAGQAAAAAEKK